ncbi:MAG: 4-hydroxyphenylpyruvate dioxygenase [Cyanobacteria bacterium J06632_22]
MDFHHVRFYVDDARRWAEWLTQTLQFAWVGESQQLMDDTVWLRQGAVQIALTAPRCDRSPIAQYLRQHPPGVVDVAFAVPDLPATLQRLWRQGARLLQPIQRRLLGGLSRPCAQVAGWDGVVHTLVQVENSTPPAAAVGDSDWAVEIDHAVLNVPKGQLQPAVAWYAQTFGFQTRQRFDIQTPTSGLHSQVLVHPQGNAQMPINEPSTANSQIQEFLLENRGAGIQHMALRTADLLKTVTRLQTSGLRRLFVPQDYYQQLTHRSGYDAQPIDWTTVRQQQLLVDWPATQPQALLLQTFTEPMFEQPTFFWELIERRQYCESGQAQLAQGFGEGNFKALFEAVERRQQCRTVSG